MALVAGCTISGGNSTGRGTPIPPATLAQTATPIPTASPNVSGYPITVYFSKSPESENSLTAVFPVSRVSPSPQVETFSIQLLIAGPTPEERVAGYYTELGRLFTNGTRCASPSPAGLGGPDFTLSLNHKGTKQEQGTATIQFCRGTLSPGIGTDARVTAEIKATLLQFATIKKVVLLDVGGNCFGDESGMNRCLN
jgi:hypothetical protein